MSACDFTRKEVFQHLNNKIEEQLPEGSVMDSYADYIGGSTSKIYIDEEGLLKGQEGLEKRKSIYSHIFEFIQKLNDLYKKIVPYKVSGDFISLDPRIKGEENIDYKYIDVKYKNIDILKDSINNYNNYIRNNKSDSQKYNDAASVKGMYDEYVKSLQEYRDKVKENSQEFIDKARVDVLKEAKQSLPPKGDNTFGSSLHEFGDKKGIASVKTPQQVEVKPLPKYEPSHVPNWEVVEEDPDKVMKEIADNDKTEIGRTPFNAETSIDVYHSLVKARTQYGKHIKNFMWELQRHIDIYESKLQSGRATDNDIAKLIHAKDIHDKFKILWFAGDNLDKLDANAFMDMIIDEIKILEEDALNGHNISLLFKRFNFLKMLLNGEGFDGSRIDGNLGHVNDRAMYEVRRYFADVENHFINLANKKVVKDLMSNSVFKKNMSAMGIKDISQIAELSTAKGDISMFEQLFKGISFSDSDSGMMPEMMKVLFHQVQVKHLAEAEKQKQKLADAAKAVGKDTEFAKERDRNGNVTGKLIQPFMSVWSDILNSGRTPKERRDIYAEYAEKIDYTLIPELYQKYGGMFPSEFRNSTKSMNEYSNYLRRKLGSYYDVMLKNADRKLQEYARVSMIEKDTTKFNPFGQHNGTNETFYMEFIPKKEEHWNEGYNNLSDAQRNYVETLISINKSFLSTNLEEHGQNSYGKFLLGMIDSVKLKNGIGAKVKAVFRHGLKMLYINRDAITGTKVDPKYIDDFDAFKGNVYRRLRNMPIEDVMKYAEDFGINIPSGVTNITEISDYIANALYKSELEQDLTSVTEKLIDIAASSATRNEMLPIAQNMYRYFSIYNYNKPNIQKTMRNFIDIVIRGLRPKDLKVFEKVLASNVKLEDINTLEDVRKIILTNRDMTENDKVILDLIRKGAEVDLRTTYVKFVDADGNIYYNDIKKGEYFKNNLHIGKNEFEQEYAKKLATDLNKTGIPMTIGSVFRGLNTVILHKYLGLSPISGLVNRWQGMNDNGLADVTGYYWTTGNLAKAQRFLNLSNFMNYTSPSDASNDRLGFINRMIPQKKRDEMEKLRKFTRLLGLNIYDKDGRTISDMLMSWAIKDPEFKNQMEIFLSILQDVKIKDVDGNEYQVFDGEELVPYELVDGKLKLKMQFRTDENVDMFENFIEGKSGDNPIAEFVAKHQKALSHIQNNFDDNDTTTTANNLFLSTFAMLKKWIVSGFMQRFDSGQGRDYTFNKKKKEGRYITGMRRKGAGLSFVAGHMGLALGLGAGLGTLGIMGGVFGAIYLGYKMYMKKKFNQDIKTNALNVQELALFWKSALLSTIDFPVRIFAGRGLVNHADNNNIGMGDLTPEEIGNIKALGMELGNKAALLAMSLAALAMLYDEDDNEESKKRRFYNYMANRLSGLIYDNAIYLNPSEALNSISRVGLVDFTKNIFEATTLIYNGDDMTDARKERMLMKITPLPNTVVNTLFRGNPFSSDQYYGSELIKNTLQSDEKRAERHIRITHANFNHKYFDMGYEDPDQLKALKKKYLPKKGKNESKAEYIVRLRDAYNSIDWNELADENPPVFKD